MSVCCVASELLVVMGDDDGNMSDCAFMPDSEETEFSEGSSITTKRFCFSLNHGDVRINRAIKSEFRASIIISLSNIVHYLLD